MQLVQELRESPRKPAALPLPLAADSDIVVCSRYSPQRAALEAFIQEGFRAKHGAEVRSFMPVLLGLREASGDLVGAAGYRSASAEPLYLEQYLPRPVEEMIPAALQGASGIDRSGVAEIGNFACVDCATAMSLVGILTEFLEQQGHRWVVFTATRTVRGIMQRLGISLTELGPADKSRVVVTGDDWGRYYQLDPRVMLGYVPSYRGFGRKSGSC